MILSVLALFLTGTIALGETRRTAARPPNIVLILADDMGPESIGPYGSEIETPNLARLAAQGLKIDNAYAMPLCSPTRVRLMTGKDSHRNYKDFGQLDEQETTFAKVLQRAGYRTMVAGKWQLAVGFERTLNLVGATPAAAGFDQYLVHNLTGEETGSRYWGPTLYRDGKRQIIEDRVYGSDLVNSYVLDFIDKNKDRPFLVYYTMFEPHDPWVLTPDMAGPADRGQRYRGMVSYMDKLIGRVLDKIEAAGLSKNTLIIFTSDNGAHPAISVRRNGVEVRGGKSQTTDAGTLVPFIAAWPGVIAPGRVSPALVDLADVMPTFGEIAGAPPAPDIDGVSLMPLFTGRKSQLREFIFHAYRATGRQPASVYAFDARYKLYADGRFFDRQNDPLEKTALAETALSGSAKDAHNLLSKVIAERKQASTDAPANE